MRIVQLVSRRQRRGAEVFASDLSAELTSLGHEVYFMGLESPPPEPLFAECQGNLDVEVDAKSVRDIGRLRRLGVAIQRLEPDVIQANGGRAMKVAVLSRLITRSAWPIVYCNIGMSSDWLKWPGQRRWNQWLMSKVQFTAAVSDLTQEDLINTYRLSKDRVRVVKRGLQTEELRCREEVRFELENHGIPKSSPLLVHVGSFTPEKNHEGLLRIFARTRRRLPEAYLLLVGDGEMKAGIEGKAPDNIHFLGVRKDVPRLLAASDLMLLPSLTEGIPGVVLEAAVQRVPTIAYDVGGIKEVVGNGVTGCLMDLGDEEGMASAATRLLGDHFERKRLGNNARAYVVANHSMVQSVESFVGIYQELTAQREPQSTR